MTKARIQTFGRWWPHEHTKGWYGTTKRMASAGFFYAPEEGSIDRVQCPYCDLALDGWEATDDPVHEHQRRCPSCPFFATRAAAPTKASAAKATKSKRKGNGGNDSQLSKEQSLLMSPKAQRVHEIKLEELEDRINQSSSSKSEASEISSRSSVARNRNTAAKEVASHSTSRTHVESQSESIVSSIVKSSSKVPSATRTVDFDFSPGSAKGKAVIRDAQIEGEETEPPRRRSLRLQNDGADQSVRAHTPTIDARRCSSSSEASGRTSSISTRKRRQQSSMESTDASSSSVSRFAYLSKSSRIPGISVVVTKRRKVARGEQAQDRQSRGGVSGADSDESGEEIADPSPNLTSSPNNAFDTANTSSPMSTESWRGTAQEQNVNLADMDMEVPTDLPIVPKAASRKRRGRPKKIKEESEDEGHASLTTRLKKNTTKRTTRRATRFAASIKPSSKKQPKALIEIFPENDGEKLQVAIALPEDSATVTEGLLGSTEDTAAPELDSTGEATKVGDSIKAITPNSPPHASSDSITAPIATLATTDEGTDATTFSSATLMTPDLQVPEAAVSNSDDSNGNKTGLGRSVYNNEGCTTPVRNRAVSMLDMENAEVVVVDPLTPIRRAASKTDLEGWEDEESRESSSTRVISPFISPSQWPLDGTLSISTPKRTKTPILPIPSITPRQRVKDMVGNATLKASTRHFNANGTPSPGTPLKRKAARHNNVSPEKKHNQLIDRLEGLMHENAASEVMAVAEYALMEEVRDLKRSQNRERKQLAEVSTTPFESEHAPTTPVRKGIDRGFEKDEQSSRVNDTMHTPVRQTGSRSYVSTTPLTTPISKTPLPISKVISAIGAASRRNNNTAASPFVRTPVKKAVGLLRLEDLEMDGPAIKNIGQDPPSKNDREETRPDSSHAVNLATAEARHMEDDEQRAPLKGYRDKPTMAEELQPQRQRQQAQQQEQQPRSRRFHQDPDEDQRRQQLLKQTSLTERELTMTVEEFHRACVAEMVLSLEIQAEELVQKFEEESERVRRALLDDGMAESRNKTKSIELERCSVCKKRYYCNRDCFTVAWKGWHRWICADKDMEDLDYEMLKMVVMSIERLRNGAYTEPEDDQTISIHDGSSSGTKREEPLALTAYVFSTLLGHEAVSDPAILANYKEIATRVRDQMMGSKFVFKSEISGGKPPSVDELIQHLCRFHCNNFSIHDSQLFTMAEGTFPVGALFNHSCRPNAIVMYEGQIQIVRALEDIAPGQEVCTSYVDNGVQRRERRQMLKEKYYFDCRCPRCDDEVQQQELDQEQDQGSIAVGNMMEVTTRVERTGFRMLDDLIEGDQDGPDSKKVDGEWLTKQFETIILPGARSLQVAGPPLQRPSLISRASFTSYVIHSLVPLIQTGASEQEYTGRLFEIYKTLSEIPHCSPKPFTTTVMTNATSFFNTCLEHQSWALASKIGIFVLALYLMIYPRHHPLVGLHCFTLAKSLWNDVEGGMTSVRLSHEILTLTENILAVSHGTTGENGALVKEVKEFKKTVETELLS
ncbi:hypothetical protein BGX28_007347 [Mortierella sp. GBA30]|nr:hypothetical protein BGX28_007347 [Mortierella sp. GBA30]